MPTRQEAKEEVRKLVKKFSDISADELDRKSEADIKSKFIEPLFEALGWQKDDMELEARVLKGRADYILRIGNQEILVIEAKKTGVNLTEDEGRQAVSYAYHRKIKFAVLTNFKEIRVYHALSNIKNINKNLLKDRSGYLSIRYDEFEKQFDRLWLLSRESFEKGEMNKLLSAKDERLSKLIDESILDDLLQFREWLSKDLKKLRVYLTQEQIDEVVQILIDRLIFMRSVEDRGLEDKDFLLNIVADFQQGRTEKRLWELIKTQFRSFDKEYNSKLFAEGLLEKEGFFDEITLVKVIRGIYFGTKDHQERYMFDEIPGDLLGNIYEQYLGTILRGTEKRVSLEKESGKRKKMGIYYTPSYIVDYIVRNTVGEYTKNKSIDEILEVKIVDPACGSGSFLIRAFQEVCDAIEGRLKKGEKSKKWAGFKDYKERLNLSQKATILTNCIYGVDLDEKAVELAQLNLLLRLLEGETKETKKLLLPNMKDNIKCGNSLIDDLSVSDKAFGWQAQFPKVFSQGGFDIVVGNPPYINNRNLEENQKKFFEKNYSTAYQQYDIYVLFYELALKLLRNSGWLGFITPNKFAITNYGLPLRKTMLENKLVKITDVSQLGVFAEASTYPYIVVIQKTQSANSNIKVYLSKSSDLEKCDLIEIKQNSLNFEEPFLFKNELESSVLNKINGERVIDIYRAKPTSKNINESGDASVITNREVERYNLVHSSERISKKEEWSIQTPAILMKKICFVPTATILTSDELIPINTVYVIHSKNQKISLQYLLSILNSKLMGYYTRRKYATTAMRGGFIELRAFEIENIPIKNPSEKEKQKISELVDKMLFLQKKLHEGKISGNEKELLEQQIRQVDWQIDQEVYRLYGITEEEKKIIEEGLK